MRRKFLISSVVSPELLSLSIIILIIIVKNLSKRHGYVWDYDIKNDLRNGEKICKNSKNVYKHIDKKANGGI